MIFDPDELKNIYPDLLLFFRLLAVKKQRKKCKNTYETRVKHVLNMCKTSITSTKEEGGNNGSHKRKKILFMRDDLSYIFLRTFFVPFLCR